MTTNKRRKSSRLQGSNTHGWGRNKHRKAGSRGGVGNAGMGKKGHCKEPSRWGLKYFGKRGFVRKGSCVDVVPINLRDLEDCLPRWKRENLVREEGGSLVVDLGKLGYNRLLGSGSLRTKAKIIVLKASQSAVKKVEAAGGELVVANA